MTLAEKEHAAKTTAGPAPLFSLLPEPPSMSAIFDAPIHQLSQGLNLTLHRQNLINSNVSNLETPGFIPSDLDFPAALSEALDAGAGAAGAPESVLRPDKAASANGNLVDLDVQMARLAQNSMFYGAQTRAVSRKLGLLKYAASEGGA